MSAFNDRILGLHFNGSNGSTTFTDNSPTPKTVNGVGGIALSTTESKFGGSSLRLSGSGQYLTVSDDAEFDLPGAFTLECWVRFSSDTSGANSYIFSFLNGANVGYIINRDASNNLRFSINFSGGIVGSTAITSGAWHHIALVKNASGVCTLYLDGVSQGTSTQAAGLTPSGIVVGSNPGTLGANLWAGYIDELMITKGIAKWSANFTPPTTQYSDSSTVDGEISGVGIIQPPIGSAFLLRSDYAAASGFIQDITGDAALFVSPTATAAGLVQDIIGDSACLVSPAISGNGVIQSIISDAALAMPNYFGGDGIISQLIGSTTIRHYIIVDKPQIVSRRYRAKIADTTDFFFPISSISMTLRRSARGSVSLVCPDGINHAADILARYRTQGSTVTLYEDEIFIDGSIETTEKTIENLGVSYGRGARNFSLTITGDIPVLRHSTPKAFKLQGIQYESLQANGFLRVRCDVNKDILPDDYVTTFDGKEIVVGTVQYVVTSNSKNMEVVEAGE